MRDEGCEACWRETIVVEDIAQRCLAYGQRLNACEHSDLEAHGGWLAPIQSGSTQP